jgi:flavin reductase (DIM6/NTAB) family NADH-FMN oxidoreductase RutF
MSSKGASATPAAIDPLLYRRTCAKFATGITVVTVADEHGRPHGVTVNSFSSVSLQPPLVLVSIDLKNSLLGHFISCTSFAINVLAEDQEPLSHRFASANENRFEGVSWSKAKSGSPLLDGAIAHLECSVARRFEVGDHTLLIGEVLRAGFHGGKPLVFFDSSYQRLP